MASNLPPKPELAETLGMPPDDRDYADTKPTQMTSYRRDDRTDYRDRSFPAYSSSAPRYSGSPRSRDSYVAPSSYGRRDDIYYDGRGDWRGERDGRRDRDDRRRPYYGSRGHEWEGEWKRRDEPTWRDDYRDRRSVYDPSPYDRRDHKPYMGDRRGDREWDCRGRRYTNSPRLRAYSPQRDYRGGYRSRSRSKPRSRSKHRSASPNRPIARPSSASNSPLRSPERAVALPHGSQPQEPAQILSLERHARSPAVTPEPRSHFEDQHEMTQEVDDEQMAEVVTASLQTVVRKEAMGSLLVKAEPASASRSPHEHFNDNTTSAIKIEPSPTHFRNERVGRPERPKQTLSEADTDVKMRDPSPERPKSPEPMNLVPRIPPTGPRNHGNPYGQNPFPSLVPSQPATSFNHLQPHSQGVGRSLTPTDPSSPASPHTSSAPGPTPTHQVGPNGGSWASPAQTAIDNYPTEPIPVAQIPAYYTHRERHIAVSKDIPVSKIDEFAKHDVERGRRIKSAKEYFKIYLELKKVTHELEMSTIELRGAEGRRKLANEQMDLAKAGRLGIDHEPVETS